MRSLAFEGIIPFREKPKTIAAEAILSVISVSVLCMLSLVYLHVAVVSHSAHGMRLKRGLCPTYRVQLAPRKNSALFSGLQ